MDGTNRQGGFQHPTRRAFAVSACAWGITPFWSGLCSAGELPRPVEFVDVAVSAAVDAADQGRRAELMAFIEPLATLAAQFTKALEGLKPKLQAGGKLEELVELERELGRVTPGLTVQQESRLAEIARLQGIYASQLDHRATRLRQAILKSEEGYRGTLEALALDLVRKGKTADAGVVSGLRDESARRVALMKAMVGKGIDHIDLCDEALGRVVESPTNDGRTKLAFGRSFEVQAGIDDPKMIMIKEAIFMPAHFQKISIVEYDIPPGFRMLSFMGVAAFGGQWYFRLANYEVQVNGKKLAAFTSDAVHWPKIIVLPEDARTLRFISHRINNADLDHTYFAWPRLHTGLSRVAEHAGWPSAVHAIYQKQVKEELKARS